MEIAQNENRCVINRLKMLQVYWSNVKNTMKVLD
jgi:hypothetical protein